MAHLGPAPSKFAGMFVFDLVFPCNVQKGLPRKSFRGSLLCCCGLTPVLRRFWPVPTGSCVRMFEYAAVANAGPFTPATVQAISNRVPFQIHARTPPIAKRAATLLTERSDIDAQGIIPPPKDVLHSTYAEAAFLDTPRSVQANEVDIRVLMPDDCGTSAGSGRRCRTRRPPRGGA